MNPGAIPSSVPAVVLDRISERFPDATQILLSGSHIKGCATRESDIDIFVFRPQITEIVREVVRVEGQLVDLAVHDFKSIRNILVREHAMSSCALAEEILQGVFLMTPCEESRALKSLCCSILQEGPKPFDLDALRSHLLSQVSDLRQCTVPCEQHVIALGLSFKLMLFEVRSRGGWMGTGRHLARDLATLSPGFVERLAAATKQSLSHDGNAALIDMVEGAIRRHFGAVDRQWFHCAPVLR